MIKKAINYLLDLRCRQHIAIALARGGVMLQSRDIGLSRPETWEFGGFSQNGEDGVISVLRQNLLRSNKYFMEIGAADGMQNNTSWLAITEQFAGLMIDGDAQLINRARRIIPYYSLGVECLHMMADINSGDKLKALALHLNPDVFSLDIDGIDYYVAQSIFAAGFRPKICVVEYNSVFGPYESLSVPYREGFSIGCNDPTRLYYGVSITGWRKFFENLGYHFVTVDTKGVNAFFVDPECFDSRFFEKLRGLSFQENLYQQRKFNCSFEEQFKLIKHNDFFQI